MFGKRVRQSRKLWGETISAFEGHRHGIGDSSTGRNASHGQNMSPSFPLILLLNMCRIEWRKYPVKTSAVINKIKMERMGFPSTSPKDIADEHIATFVGNSSARYSTKFQTIKEQDKRVQIDFYVWQHQTLQQTLHEGDMVSSMTYIGLVSEADCLFLWVSTSGTAEFESASGLHSLMNFIQKKEYQLVVSWLLHALE